MNLYILDRNTHRCAVAHCDEDIAPAIMCSAQLLSTTCHLLGDVRPLHLASSHELHPCAEWVRMRQPNYTWTHNLFGALLAEHSWRFKRFHEYEWLWPELAKPPKAIEAAERRSTFVQCVIHPCIDAVLAYRTYYTESRIKAKWTRRTKPEWWP